MSAPIADVRFLRGVFASLVFATAMCVAGVVYALLGTLSSSRDDGFLLALSLLVLMCRLSQRTHPMLWCLSRCRVESPAADVPEILNLWRSITERT